MMFIEVARPPLPSFPSHSQPDVSASRPGIGRAVAIGTVKNGWTSAMVNFVHGSYSAAEPVAAPPEPPAVSPTELPAALLEATPAELATTDTPADAVTEAAADEAGAPVEAAAADPLLLLWQPATNNEQARRAGISTEPRHAASTERGETIGTERGEMIVTERGEMIVTERGEMIVTR
jgi:hypothetical protein